MALADLMRGKTLEGHPIQINRFPGPDDLTRVHMLFIGDAERSRIDTIIKQIGALAREDESENETTS